MKILIYFACFIVTSNALCQEKSSLNQTYILVKKYCNSPVIQNTFAGPRIIKKSVCIDSGKVVEGLLKIDSIIEISKNNIKMSSFPGKSDKVYLSISNFTITKKNDSSKYSLIKPYSHLIDAGCYRWTVNYEAVSYPNAELVVKKYIVVDNLKQNGKMEKPYPAFDENNIWIPIENLAIYK